MRQDLGQNGVSKKLEIDEQFLTLLCQVQLLSVLELGELKRIDR